MEESTLKLWRKYTKLKWKYGSWTKTGTKEQNTFLKLEEYMKERKNYSTEKKEFEKIQNRRHQSMLRYKKYLQGMFNNYVNLYWVTFTIKDEHMNKDTKRYLKQWFKEHAKDYICNEDYGEKTGRKHYHAVIASKDNYFTYPYGNIKVKEINIRRGTDLLTKYANKFSNHATKTGTQKIFHPRGFKEIEKIQI